MSEQYFQRTDPATGKIELLAIFQSNCPSCKQLVKFHLPPRSLPAGAEIDHWKQQCEDLHREVLRMKYQQLGHIDNARNEKLLREILAELRKK